jgi:hypothetical protein
MRIELLLSAGLALAAQPPADPAGAEGMRFQPADGSVLVKRFNIGHELNLDSVGQVFDGGPFQAERLTSTISTWFTLTAEDRYLELSDGRGRRLRRTYLDLGGGGKLNMRPEGFPQQPEQDAVLVSPLRNRSVDFTWIDAEQDWSRCWSTEHFDEEWLAGIRGDMDLLALLPPGEVAEGQGWELPIGAVRALLAPGGNHLITPRTPNVFSRTIEVGVGGDFSEILGPDLLGRLTATFTGVREQDGKRLAVVELSIEGLQSFADRTALYRTAMPEEERREQTRLVTVLLEYRLDARGELLWDLDAGHAHSVELSGEETFINSMTKELPTQGRLARIDAQATFSGTLTLSFEVAPRGADGPR